MLSIRPTSSDDVETAALIGELHAETSAPDTATGSEVTLQARLDGVAVGCGAYRMLDDTTAEVTQIYVRTHARGRLIGAALRDNLEHRARWRRCEADRPLRRAAVSDCGLLRGPF